MDDWAPLIEEDIEFPEPFSALEEPFQHLEKPNEFPEPLVGSQDISRIQLKRTRYAPPPAAQLREPRLNRKRKHEESFTEDSDSQSSSSGDSQSSSSTSATTDEFSSSAAQSASSTSESSTATSDCVFPEDIPLDDSGFDSTVPQSEPLFPDSSLSVVAALGVLFSWFAACPGVTKESFGRLLFILHKFLLPLNNSLPSCYADAYALIKDLLCPIQEYHCCVNDCIVYRGAYRDLTQCPMCKEPRFRARNIPRKRFKYLPLGPRICRYFGNAEVSKLLQSHHTSKPQDTHGVHDIHHTETWKRMFSRQGIFSGDKRGLALAICADGTNPFSKEKNKYTMWPITVSILNLPPSVRHVPGFLQLVGIVPGKSEPKNMDPYLDILTDELLQLNTSCTFDAYRNETFSLQTSLVLHVFDYPGQNKVFHSQGAGAYAGCCYCNHLGEYSEALTKVVYLDHRRFLPPHDPLRKERSKFPSKKAPAGKPTPKTMAFVDSANKRYQSARTAKEKKKVAQETGCKGSYALRKLPHHDRLLSTPVEPMHLIKNMVEHLVRLIVGTEDSVKVRQEEQVRGRFRRSWVKQGQVHLPSAPFRLTVSEQKIANERALSIKVPTGFDWRPAAIFVDRVSMKSHAWKLLVSTSILKYCLRGLLGTSQRRTLFFFLDLLAQLCVEVVDVTHVDTLENDIHHALSLLERDFPVSLHVIVFHLLHHLPAYIHRFGPIYTFWMFSFERFNSWIIRRVHNRRYPESTVMETYRLHEWAYFLQAAGDLPDKAVLCPEDVNETVSIRTSMQLDDKELSYLQLYYKETVPLYSSLCSRYEEDKKKAKGQHRLRAFPPMASWIPKSGPTLTPVELAMCKGISSEAIKVDHFSYRDIHGRKVILSGKIADRAGSYTSFHLQDNSIIIGQIDFLFQHCFDGNTDTFAFVRWLGNPRQEKDSGISYVNLMCNSNTNPIVHACQLSKPLVTAVDLDTPSKLWILS